MLTFVIANARSELIVKTVFVNSNAPAGSLIVTDNQHLTIKSAAVGSTLNFKVYAIAVGTDVNTGNDGVTTVLGGFVSKDTGGGVARGTLSSFYVTPFGESSPVNGASGDWDGDLDQDVMGASPSAVDGWFKAGAQGTHPYLAPNDGTGIQIGTLSFTVSDVLGGTKTVIDFWPAATAYGAGPASSHPNGAAGPLTTANFPILGSLGYKIDGTATTTLSGYTYVSAGGAVKSASQVNSGNQSFTTLGVTIVGDSNNTSKLSIPTSYAMLVDPFTTLSFRQILGGTGTPGSRDVTNSDTASDGKFTATGGAALTVYPTAPTTAVAMNGGTMALNFGWASTGTIGTRSGTITIANADNPTGDTSNHSMTVAGAVVDNRKFDVNGGTFAFGRVMRKAPLELGLSVAGKTVIINTTGLTSVNGGTGAETDTASVTIKDATTAAYNDSQVSLVTTGGGPTGFLVNSANAITAALNARFETAGFHDNNSTVFLPGSGGGALLTGELTGQDLSRGIPLTYSYTAVNNRSLTVSNPDLSGIPAIVMKGSTWAANAVSGDGADDQNTMPNVVNLSSPVVTPLGTKINGVTSIIKSGSINGAISITYPSYSAAFSDSYLLDLAGAGIITKEGLNGVGLEGEALNFSAGSSVTVDVPLRRVGQIALTETAHASVAIGGSLAGLSARVTNGDFATEATILAGTNTSGAALTNLGMKFRLRKDEEKKPSPALPAGIGFLASDVVELSGMPSSGVTYALQMNYDPSLFGGNAAELAAFNSGYLYLGYLNGTVWANAAKTNPVKPYDVSHAFVPATDELTPNDFVLGYYGIDTDANVVWAVIDHASEFAVVPEPGTLLLLAAGGLCLVVARLRRKQSV